MSSKIDWVDGFSRSTTATYFDVNGVMQTAAINVLRNAHYLNGVLQPPLIEGASTNYAIYSQDLTQASSWNVDSSGTGTTPTRTANYAVAPDGTTTATRVQFSKTAGAGFSRLLGGGTPSPPSAVYVTSVYLKTNDGSYRSLSFGDGTANRRVISVGPNWQRFAITGTAPTATPGMEILVWDTTNTSLTADMLIWGVRIESAGVASTTYLPNHANISQSDYCAIATKDATKVSLVRPIVDGQKYELYNPGARVARFKTDSSYIGIRLTYTEWYTRTDTYNAIGWVLIDGVAFQAFSQTIAAVSGTPTTQLVEMMTGKQMKTVEVVMPHGMSVDLTSVDLEATATLSAAAPRPTTRYVAIGDSITHGYFATSVLQSWPYLLAKAKDWQLINVGYGGRLCVAGDGTVLGNQNPDVASYLIGYNDFFAQTALATFKSTYTSFINNFRAVKPSVKLYCITPTWSANTAALTLEMYRQQIRDALTTLANPLNVLVEGLTLATNNASSFTSDPHPNDVGSQEMTTALTAIVAV